MNLAFEPHSIDLSPPRKTHKEKVSALKDAIDQLPQVPCPVREYSAPGLYAREITIPAGTSIVGAVHKRENLAVLSKGRMVLATESGPIEIEAPCTLTVRPGTANAATAISECVWTNFFATEETDPEKLVELLTESTAAELIGGDKNVQLQTQRLKELEN